MSSCEGRSVIWLSAIHTALLPSQEHKDYPLYALANPSSDSLCVKSSCNGVTAI